MWKVKIEEWIASLIPYINVPLDQYDPTEWRPKEISPQFLEDVDGKSELIALLNPRLFYIETTTGYMVKLRTMLDLLELLEKRGVNVEQYVIRRKETPEAPVYEGPLQTVQLEMADVRTIPASIEDLSQLEPQITKLGKKEMLEMRDNKVRQLNEEYGLCLTEKDIYIVANKLIISASAEKLIKQAKHQKEMTDVFIASADQTALIIWEQSLPFQFYSNVPWEGTNEYIVIDNLLIDIQKQRVLAELKTEEERKVWSPTGCEFKPTKRKFSKSIRNKLDETRKSARQDDLQ